MICPLPSYPKVHVFKIPGIKFKGIDISDYAIKNSKPEIRESLSVADAKRMPFPDKSFDVVISINTIHNLDREECMEALREITRVSKKYSFLTVDAYRNEEECNLEARPDLT